MKLCFWTTAHRPSLFPLVSTPLLPRSDSRKTATWSTPFSLQRARPARISPVTSALRAIPGLKMVAKGCGKCNGKGAIECQGCKVLSVNMEHLFIYVFTCLFCGSIVDEIFIHNAGNR
uniref:Uncharacterized protein n=1 Tax=Picea sitchensis TaxID=3332 RepID=A9NTY3_PICSI|nr:unknown [Picea sitchensis]